MSPNTDDEEENSITFLNRISSLISISNKILWIIDRVEKELARARRRFFFFVQNQVHIVVHSRALSIKAWRRFPSRSIDTLAQWKTCRWRNSCENISFQLSRRKILHTHARADFQISGEKFTHLQITILLKADLYVSQSDISFFHMPFIISRRFSIQYLSLEEKEIIYTKHVSIAFCIVTSRFHLRWRTN